MKGREAFGYVVSIEGSKVILNLKDTYRGHFASHRDGISTVTQINGLFGVDAGSRILVLRVISLSFIEPREVHKTVSPRASFESEPLRQLIGTVTGYLSKQNGKLRFMPDSLISPSLGAEAFPLSSHELAAIMQPAVAQPTASLILGYDSRGGGTLQADISDLLGRHVAVLGSTGQGKSCFTAAMLQKILKLHQPRIIVFDINGEFIRAVKGHVTTEKLKVTELGGENSESKIPYYALGRHGLSRLLLPSEKTQRPALSFAIDHLCHVKWFPEKRGAGLATDNEANLFDDCRPGDATDAWNTIEKLRNGKPDISGRWPHMAALACLVAESHSLKQKSGKYERDGFHYSNIAPLVTRIKRLLDDPMFTSIVNVEGGKPANNSKLDWGKEGTALVERVFGDKSSSWKIHIVNLRSVAHDLMPLVLGSLLELFAFELFRRGQGNSYPTLLVLEEAHHYLRQYTGDEESLRQSLAYERLAKEGRKFGLGLWVSTQRPSEVSPTVLAQCGTWVVFRLTSEQDLRAVGSAGEWVDRLELNRISGLPRQQALVFGASISIPLRIIAPTANPTPKSADPDFGQWLQEEKAEK